MAFLSSLQAELSPPPLCMPSFSLHHHHFGMLGCPCPVSHALPKGKSHPCLCSLPFHLSLKRKSLQSTWIVQNENSSGQSKSASAPHVKIDNSVAHTRQVLYQDPKWGIYTGYIDNTVLPVEAKQWHRSLEDPPVICKGLLFSLGLWPGWQRGASQRGEDCALAQ